MTTQLDPIKISQLLNQSSRNLDDATLSRLQQSRALALQKQATPARALSFATGRWTHLLVPHSTQQWLTAGFLAVLVMGGASLWQQNHHQQIIDLDVQLLTDELPIEIFVDEQR